MCVQAHTHVHAAFTQTHILVFGNADTHFYNNQEINLF